jgi:hypothetical protein
MHGSVRYVVGVRPAVPKTRGVRPAGAPSHGHGFTVARSERLRTRLRDVAAWLGGPDEWPASQNVTAEPGDARPPSRSNAVLVLPALIVAFVAVGIGWSSVSGERTREVLSKRELNQFLADDQVRNDRAFCTAVAAKGSPGCPDLAPSRSAAPRFSVTGACQFALDDYEKWFSRTILAGGWQDFPRWREAARQVREQCGPDPERTWGNLLVQ